MGDQPSETHVLDHRVQLTAMAQASA